MQNVFVTGATGFVGISLIKELSKCTEINRIYCLYRTKIPFLNDKIIWIYGDMDNLPLFSQQDNVVKVIHCAALMNGNCTAKFLYDSNIVWTQKILEMCRKCGINEIVMYSSINVNLQHRGAYAKSKIRSEEILINSGLKVKIIRPALIFGKGKNGINKLVHYISRFPLVPVFGNGHAKEQPIYIEDLVKLSVKYILDNNAKSIIELCGKCPMDYDVMIRNIAEVLGRKIIIFHLPFYPFYYIVKFFENINLILPISSEQIAHTYENLSCNMDEIYNQYQIFPLEFKDYLKMLYL